MNRIKFLIFCFLSTTCALKVMDLNMHGYGLVHDGIRKIADQIKAVNPDIVTVQWIDSENDKVELMKLMGNGWSIVTHCNESRISIVTRHEILSIYEHVRGGFNVRIQLRESGNEISVWSMFLNEYTSTYGPEEAKKGNATSLNTIMETQTNRIDYAIELLKHPKFVQQIKNADTIPVIVAGNFWIPSHLDWIDSTKDRNFGWVVEWPVTKLLSEAAGLTDSFREVHSDPVKDPGFTLDKDKNWFFGSMDRISYIFYRGSLNPISSYTYAGTTPLARYADFADFENNEWPSFYRAVVTEFEHTLHKNGNKFSVFLGPEYSDRKYEMIGKCPMKNIE